MKITELKFRFDFTSLAYIDILPAFALRSVLGMNLKRMHCVSHNTPCSDCPFVATCAYAFLFESIVSKENTVLPGRDRASHPFRIAGPLSIGRSVANLEFSFQLFGRAIEYIPHIVYAFRIAGNNGLFRSRTRFETHAFTKEGDSIDDGEKINLKKIEINKLVRKGTNQIYNHSLNIHCSTPVRFKTKGTYSSDFNASDFINACKRRVGTLFELYGDNEDYAHHDSYSETTNSQVEIIARNLRWIDFTRYSARQGSAMKLGGVLGSFSLRGEASEKDWDALKTCAQIGVGKNTSFGLGSIAVNEVDYE